LFDYPETALVFLNPLGYRQASELAAQVLLMPPGDGTAAGLPIQAHPFLVRGVFAIVGCPSASFECSFYVNLFRSYCMCSMCEMCSERTALHSVQASVSSPGIDKTRRKANWPTHQVN